MRETFLSTLNDAAGPLLLQVLSLTIILTVLLSLLRKRVFNVAVAFVRSAVGVASYVQASILERWYATCRSVTRLFGQISQPK